MKGVHFKRPIEQAQGRGVAAGFLQSCHRRLRHLRGLHILNTAASCMKRPEGNHSWDYSSLFPLPPTHDDDDLSPFTRPPSRKLMQGPGQAATGNSTNGATAISLVREGRGFF